MRFRLVAFLALLTIVVSCTPTDPPGPSYPATESYAASLGVDIPSMTRYDTNLYYKDLTVGTGATASPNKKISVAYTGYLTDGSSFESGQLDTVPLSTVNLIAGW